MTCVFVCLPVHSSSVTEMGRYDSSRADSADCLLSEPCGDQYTPPSSDGQMSPFGLCVALLVSLSEMDLNEAETCVLLLGR